MFCTKCGKEIQEGQSFCNHCGQNQSPSGTPFVPQSTAGTGDVVSKLSSKIKIEAYIWLGVAAAQVLIGLGSVIMGLIYLIEWGEGFSNILSGILIWVIAVLNVKTALGDLKYSKEILTKPTGIVAKYEPVKSLIITLVYNVVVGAFVGVAGAVFGFIVRDFVMKNKEAFKKVESEYTNK